MRKTLMPFALALLVLPGCDGSTPDLAAPDGATLAPTSHAAALTAVPGVTEVVGETGPGSTYALLKPADWNGSLVVYAHGYVQPFLEPRLPAAPAEPLMEPVRDQLLAEGYAFAYSSWSETAYAVKDGAQRTHQLNGLFADEFGDPDRTYLWGLSLGGLVADLLSERHGAQYDGTLATCAVLGGGQWNAEYVANFRVLFDVFYPGVLPGTLLEMPENYFVIGPDPSTGYPGSPAFQAIFHALASNPFPAMQMAAIDQIQLRWNTPNELITGFIHVLGYQVNGANALTDRLHGHNFFGNDTVTYTWTAPALPFPLPAPDMDAVNGAVARFSADPAAQNYMAHWWEPTGQIQAPFLTLHTTRDPLVPERSAGLFAGDVADAGASGLLLQRTVDAFGHCNFQLPQVLDAFQTLVQWVETGTRPGA